MRRKRKVKLRDGPSRPWTDQVPEAICHLPELGLSCFGCCGYDWAGVDRLRRDVANNTWRYNSLYTSKKVFARTTNGVRASGICKGVVKLDDGTIGCPLHPVRNGGKDLRKGDCLTRYECNTLKYYKRWSMARKRDFLAFIAERGYDPFTYSMANAKGTLLASFKRSRGLPRLTLSDLL